MRKTKITLIRLRDNGLYEVEKASRSPEWPGFVVGRGEWYLDDPNHHTTYAAYSTPFVEPDDIMDYEPKQKPQWWRMKGPNQGIVVLEGQGIVLSTVSPLEGVNGDSDDRRITEDAMTTLAERADQSAMARTHEDNKRGQTFDTAFKLMAMGMLLMVLLIFLLGLPIAINNISDTVGGDETSEQTEVEVAPGFEQPTTDGTSRRLEGASPEMAGHSASHVLALEEGQGPLARSAHANRDVVA